MEPSFENKILYTAFKHCLQTQVAPLHNGDPPVRVRRAKKPPTRSKVGTDA